MSNTAHRPRRRELPPGVAAAAEANAHYGALRAVHDPTKLARATRVVRIALRRGLVTLDDLRDDDSPKAAV